MEDKSHQSLMLAHALLPSVSHWSEPPCLGIVLCILSWIKVWSDTWHASQIQGETTPALTAGGVLTMTANCTFDAFRNSKGADTAEAIQKAIGELVRLNPTLKGVLQPGYFTIVQDLYTQAHAHQDSLHKLVTAISQIVFKNSAATLGCGAEFSELIAAVCKENYPHVRALAPLCAKLLAPQEGELVLDPACGQGYLLLACAQALAESSTTKSATKSASLHQHGMAHDVRQWSLTKMLLSLSGLPHHHILHDNPLLQPFANLTEAERALALGGADMVTMAIPADNWPWCNRDAFLQQDPRYPAFVPSDSRLALVLQGVAALKPQGGRMALIMPNHVLTSSDGEALCQHLVQNNLLDAVISLTGHAGQVLLIIRRQKSHTHIAFIQVPGSGAPGIASALQAWQRYQARQTDPCLICCDQNTVAAHHYQLDWQAYSQAVAALYGQPMTNSAHLHPAH